LSFYFPFFTNKYATYEWIRDQNIALSLFISFRDRTSRT
jgi:hypothetical protein